jgi:hypothetical protein
LFHPLGSAARFAFATLAAAQTISVRKTDEADGDSSPIAPTMIDNHANDRVASTVAQQQAGPLSRPGGQCQLRWNLDESLSILTGT